MVVVYKISKFIHIVDIHTMQTFEVDQITYWKDPFKALLGRDRLTEFIVLDIEELDTNMNDSRAAIKQKFKQVKIQVARKSDFGVNDQTYWINSHLGGILNYNDTVLGYDLNQSNCIELDEFKHEKGYKDNHPEVVVIKKYYPKYRKKNHNRIWKLKHLEKQEGPTAENLMEEAPKQKGKKKDRG